MAAGSPASVLEHAIILGAASKVEPLAELGSGGVMCGVLIPVEAKGAKLATQRCEGGELGAVLSGLRWARARPTLRGLGGVTCGGGLTVKVG